MLATMKTLFDEQRNDMVNHIVHHMSNVVKLIVINAVNDAILRLGLSNQTPLVNSVVTRNVHNPSPFINANNVGQNNQIYANNLAN